MLAALAVPLLAAARWTWRVARALQGMHAVITAIEVQLNLPTWGGWLGPGLPLRDVILPRRDIEAVEVARDPAGAGLARKAELVMGNGARVLIWHHTEGMRSQRIWVRGEGWREHTAAVYAMTHPAGLNLAGALFGFAQRSASAVDVPLRNRLAEPSTAAAAPRR